MEDTLKHTKPISDSSGHSHSTQHGPTINNEVATEYYFKDFASDVLSSSIEYNNGRVFLESDFKKPNPDWLIFVFLFCFGLIAFVKAFHSKRLGLLYKSILNWKFSKQIIRYEKLYTHPVNIALVLNFLIATPLFFALCYNEYTNSYIGLFSLAAILSAYLFTFSLIKLLSYKFISWVTEINEEMSEYIFQTNLISKFLGIIFTGLALLISYSKMDFTSLFWIGISTLIMGVGLQVIRGFLIALQKSKDLILIILYLCTLEILPLLIIGKFVLNEL